MRYGVVVDLAHAPKVSAAGYDYFDLYVQQVANPFTVDDGAFSATASALKQLPIAPEGFCMFLPPDVPVVGPDVDEERFTYYVQRALPRVKQLGGQIIVWGSGPSRRVPEGFPRAEAMKQFKSHLIVVADLCTKLDIRIALESLKRSGTNLLNTVGECLDLIDEVGQDVVGVVADNDHFSIEEPDLAASMRRAGSRVIHVHLRDSNGRVPGYGGYDFPRFVALLKDIGYTGRISVEAHMDHDTELAPTRAYLQQLCAGL